MVYEVMFNPVDNIVIGKYTGELDFDSLIEYVKEIKEVGVVNNCTVVLNDLRQMTSTFSTLDIHDLPKMLSKAGIERSWRRAIVMSKQLKDALFFETVAENRGFNTKIFTEISEAIKWLKR